MSAEKADYGKLADDLHREAMALPVAEVLDRAVRALGGLAELLRGGMDVETARRQLADLGLTDRDLTLAGMSLRAIAEGMGYGR